MLVYVLRVGRGKMKKQEKRIRVVKAVDRMQHSVKKKIFERAQTVFRFFWSVSPALQLT